MQILQSLYSTMRCLQQLVAPPSSLLGEGDFLMDRSLIHRDMQNERWSAAIEQRELVVLLDLVYPPQR